MFFMFLNALVVFISLLSLCIHLAKSVLKFYNLERGVGPPGFSARWIGQGAAQATPLLFSNVYKYRPLPPLCFPFLFYVRFPFLSCWFLVFLLGLIHAGPRPLPTLRPCRSQREFQQQRPDQSTAEAVIVMLNALAP